MAKNAQKTTLHIAGSAASALNLVSCTAGYPTILTFLNATVATALLNGDSVTIAGVSGTDAALLNVTTTVSHKAIGATNTTFTVDIDTTGKTIVGTSANATPTAWIKVGQLSNIKGSPDTVADNDVTTLDDDLEVMSPGLRSPGSVTGDIFCDDSDAGLLACEAAQLAQTTKAFKITFPTGATPVRTFSGYVKTVTTIGDASKGGVVTGSLEIKRTTLVTKA